MWYFIAALSFLLVVTTTSSASFNILDYGAIPDGKTLNTQSIVKAVNAASQSGGGHVIVPKGVFLTGAFNLSSGVYLVLDEGSVLLGSDKPSDYACLPSDTWDTGPCDYPLIGAVNAKFTGIIGTGGIINGGANDPPGHLVDHYDPTTNFLVPKLWDFPNCKGQYYCRPKLIVFKNSEYITTANVTILNSPLWTYTLVQVSHALIDNVTVKGDRRWPNNDGFDAVDTYNVTIQNSFFSTGDDGICLSTHTSVSLRNFVVRNCTIYSTSAALKVTPYGPTATGEVSDILFDNNRIYDTNRGLSIMPRIGTGDVHNVTFSNIEIHTHFFSNAWWGSAEPLYVTSLSQSTTLNYTGKVYDIFFRNITAFSENSVVVYSDNYPIKNLVFDNVTLTIGRWSNISRPCHDYRPSLPPSEEYAPVDAFYINNADPVSLTNVQAMFQTPIQSFYGICLNATKTTFEKKDFKCTDPKKNNSF